MSQVFAKAYSCPWCNRGEVLAYGKGPVRISVQCPKERCKHIFTIDLDSGKVERGQPYKRLGRRK